MANNGRISMSLNSWRGYSAYEIAVQNGFVGTEKQWLESLRGADGRTNTVNGINQQNGSITLTSADICVSPTDKRKMSEVIAQMDRLLSAITLTEDGIDLGNRCIDNALFR